MSASQPTHRDTVPTLLRGINSKRPFQAFLALILMPVGPVILWALTRSSTFTPERGPFIVALLIGAGLSAWGAFEGWCAFRPALRHPGLKTLLERPSSIVWFHGVRAKSGNAVRLHLDTGHAKDLPLRRRKDTDAALSEVRALLPHSTEGFSLELLAAYQRSPKGLRRG